MNPVQLKDLLTHFMFNTLSCAPNERETDMKKHRKLVAVTSHAACLFVYENLTLCISFYCLAYVYRHTHAFFFFFLFAARPFIEVFSSHRMSNFLQLNLVSETTNVLVVFFT